MIEHFEDKVKQTIDKYMLFNKSERLLVCLSGGADSVSLLLCLKRLGYDICACHINHQLRGEESERDQHFCEELCKKHGVEIFTYRIDVHKYCSEHSLSIEEGAREQRYSIFAGIPADKICTAHTLSDCLETTVFNLARGTGLKGLCSIPPKRDNIVRPLIRCTRNEVEEYLSQLGQEYVTDSTNLEDEYTRNRIRHNVVPVLEGINKALFQSYAQSIDILEQDQRFLDNCADKAFDDCFTDNCGNADKLKALDPAIRDRAIMKWLKQNSLAASSNNINSIGQIILNNGKFNISKELFVVCDHGIMRLLNIDEFANSNYEQINVSGSGEYIFGNKRIAFNILDFDEINCEIENVHKMFANCCLDYDKIINGLVIHKRKEGDKIRLVGRDFCSSVRKLINKAFVLEKRSDAVVIYDGDEVVFVEGYGVCDRVKITPDTKCLLSFTIEDII